jgi:TonB family protein
METCLWRLPHWIDKKLDIDLQMTKSFEIQDAPPPLPTEMPLKFAKRPLKLNESLPDSLFTFTPPPGSVDSSGNAAATPKLETEAQAFVPGLGPVERVEAVWPESARSQGVQGFVRVLVMVDAQGRVTQAEALTGPTALRQAALDAVQIGRFRPVIRNGHPVAAYTDETVHFLDRRNPATAQDPLKNMNLSEDIAGRAANRIAARAPRSAGMRCLVYPRRRSKPE